jgi:hypothetical protein
MALDISSRIKNAWNAFRNKDLNNYRYDYNSYGGTSFRTDRYRLTRGNERSIVTSIFNRIAIDVSSLKICHCRLDDHDRFKEEINSSLNNCLTLEANIDQTSESFFQDVILSMFDEGSVAIVPVDTSVNPNNSNSYEIYTLRTGKIIEWFPDKVKINLYNDRTGKKEDVVVLKKNVAIIENPFYSVMNEPNSTLQRLMRKLVLLDSVDEQTSSGKLDLIIQLPYTIKSEARKAQAEKRRQDIEEQLSGSRYGIAYTDGTEKVTQLNRSLENNLIKQIEYLTSMLYSQLGITKEIMDGTADEKVMLNYYSRTIEPIASAITNEMIRKFISKTARSQKQSIMSFRDPFKLVPANELADLADKFTRNEIMSSNEIRQIVGMKPSEDPKADELINSNIRQDGYLDPNMYQDQEGLEEEEYEEDPTDPESYPPYQIDPEKYT